MKVAPKGDNRSHPETPKTTMQEEVYGETYIQRAVEGYG
jgi:hypothetical protein